VFGIGNTLVLKMQEHYQ